MFKKCRTVGLLETGLPCKEQNLGNERTEEVNWRSGQNRPKQPRGQELQLASDSCQKRKVHEYSSQHVLLMLVATKDTYQSVKHVKTDRVQDHREDSEPCLSECDDDDSTNYVILSQDNSDTMSCFSLLDFKETPGKNHSTKLSSVEAEGFAKVNTSGYQYPSTGFRQEKSSVCNQDVQYSLPKRNGFPSELKNIPQSFEIPVLPNSGSAMPASFCSSGKQSPTVWSDCDLLENTKSLKNGILLSCEDQQRYTPRASTPTPDNAGYHFRTSYFMPLDGSKDDTVGYSTYTDTQSEFTNTGFEFNKKSDLTDYLQNHTIAEKCSGASVNDQHSYLRPYNSFDSPTSLSVLDPNSKPFVPNYPQEHAINDSKRNTSINAQQSYPKTHNCSVPSPQMSFTEHLLRQSKERVSQVFTSINGKHGSTPPSAPHTADAIFRRNSTGSSFLRKNEKEDMSKILGEPSLTEHRVTPHKLELYPSTYVTKSYYKNELPHEFIQRNEAYSNKSLNQYLLYDNWSDVDSSRSCESTPTSSPTKLRRATLPFSPEKLKSKFSKPFSFYNHWSSKTLSYNLEELFTKDLTVKVIDTHCHLDLMFRKESFKGTFGAYMLKYSTEFLPCFGGCIANFIEPNFFYEEKNWKDFLKEDNIWASFGVHPHFSNQYDEAVEECLIQALSHDRVVACGEIGLDYSVKNNCNKELQQTAFRRQLQIAVKHDKALIIHCRDAQQDCLQILTEIVPKKTRIHRHCFTGNWVEAKEWLDEFPNLFLGFTSLITYRSVSHLHKVIELTPTERILFETDAPYFVPLQVIEKAKDQKKDRRISHPGMVVHVAAQIAAIKRVTDFPKFLATVRENTKRMYQI